MEYLVWLTEDVGLKRLPSIQCELVSILEEVI